VDADVTGDLRGTAVVADRVDVEIAAGAGDRTVVGIAHAHAVDGLEHAPGRAGDAVVEGGDALEIGAVHLRAAVHVGAVVALGGREVGAVRPAADHRGPRAAIVEPLAGLEVDIALAEVHVFGAAVLALHL